MIEFHRFEPGDRVQLRDGSASGIIISTKTTKIGAPAAVVRWDDPSTRRALRLTVDLAPAPRKAATA